MRSLWIASGSALSLLVLAVVLRRGPVDDTTPAPALAVAPRPLSAEDLSQIMSLRAEFGSPADRFAGAEASQAAFEDELRQVAGANEKSPDPAYDRVSDAQTVFRQAAAEIDKLANQLEEAGRYSEADELRLLAHKVRCLARVPTDRHFQPANADNTHEGLIDNSRAPQAQ